MWLEKTGKPPKKYEEYDYVTLIALLRYGYPDNPDAKDDDDNETTIERNGPWGPPDLEPGLVAYDKAHKSGDPIVDAWEKQIEAGELPDW